MPGQPSYEELARTSFPHTCQDGHPLIGHKDSETEFCPLCDVMMGLKKRLVEWAERVMATANLIHFRDLRAAELSLQDLADEIWGLTLEGGGEMSMRCFGPKSADHPSVGKPCPACQVSFVEGDFTTLVSLGPGNNPEEQAKAREGRAYLAVAVEVHWDCSGGMEK